MPIIASVGEVRCFCFSQVVRELVHSHFRSSHRHWVWNGSATTATSPLKIDDLGPIGGLSAGPGRHITGGRLLLLFDIRSDIIGLPSQKLQFVIFCVDYWRIKLFHLFLTQNQFAEILIMFFPLLHQLSTLWRFRPIYFLSFKNHFIKSGNDIGLSARKYTMTIWNRRLRILDNRMNFPGNKEHSLNKLIITIHGEPHIYKLLGKGLDKLGDLKISKFLLFHDLEGLGCLGRLPKLIGIRGLISHLSKLVAGLLGSVGSRRLVQLIIIIFMLEFLLPSNIHYCFYQSQALFY